MPTVSEVYRTCIKYADWYDICERDDGGTISRQSQGMIMRGWSHELLSYLNVDIQLIGKPSDDKVIFVGNHVSYVDIPLLMSQVPVRFVAKAELLRWPIFNRVFKRAQIIFVKRESAKSRKRAVEQIEDALVAGDLSLAVFPSGTTDIREKKPWKKAAFHIAKNSGIKIQPFRIGYTPLRAAAYIENDFFPYHVYKIMKTPLIAKIEFHEPVEVTDPATDAKKWHKWSQELLEHSPETLK